MIERLEDLALKAIGTLDGYLMGEGPLTDKERACMSILDLWSRCYCAEKAATKTIMQTVMPPCEGKGD